MLPGLAVVVRDHVEHIGGVGGHHHGHVVAIGGHHVVVGAQLVTVGTVEVVVEAGEVDRLADVPAVAFVLDADVVDMVVE